MPAIDFHDESNRSTYARREADKSWGALIRSLVDPAGKRVADVGCGGGVYSTAWLDLGADTVTAVDFSAAMLSGARERCRGRDRLTFVQGEACATGLPDGSVDIVFERALVHHLTDLPAAFREAKRLLSPGGHLIVQDRTFDDVLRPASPSHLRGYFFDAFPALLTIERARRPTTADITTAIRTAGLTPVRTRTLTEVRRTYADADDVRQDLMARTGRSVLHHLDDDQLRRLADHVTHELRGLFPVREEDTWTVWTARA
ncbi:class I SAM-dependent methyltransferase [Streptantibioticus cattleyicolor]|uniref:Methyltransferase type 11 domain-containing protein n=1 Tax=Streptantibioticus cattleyicolor (strain ATCC 35852 / DSM 46488 / JCM 4925 / NBRC 14057 / NRRL 8057) TaxID=1003195 RepID=F8JKF4_STREN|nr:class I SAM-dependent methyltransferase [Streptantibioticus cattleyicolor]AEW99778.1 hypothetical protein SCATT_p15850 [Streptantibioticus cattleyicolor NRRL 8057 = DSM 46488]CCB71183.1 conserved protein of unknown function [Streptantibioticus cattleyicolor NRRL 8057 = DSM 46488]